MPWDNIPNSLAWRNASAVVTDLPDWLYRQRQGGSSYQFMAGTLAQSGVMVTHETVRSWCKRLEQSATYRRPRPSVELDDD